MCGSMAAIQSAAAEIRRGKKRKKKEERTNHSMKIYMVSLFHRATINQRLTGDLIAVLKSLKGFEDVLTNHQQFLWSPYGIRQTIIFLPCGFFFMAALCNRGAIIFLPCSSFLSIYLLLSFFPRLISAATDWISTILLHMAWP